MKKLLLVMFIFMFTFATNAFAHTHLESSSPENGQVVTEELREISLTFGGEIEKLSTFELSNTEGQSIPVESITVGEEQMTGTLTNPLENGNYTVDWKIVGADGHPIEGEFTFSVNTSTSGSATTSESGNGENQQNSSQDEAVHEHNEQTDDNIANEQIEEKDEGQSPSYLIPIIIIVLIVIVVGFFFGLRRKK